MKERKELEQTRTEYVMSDILQVDIFPESVKEKEAKAALKKMVKSKWGGLLSAEKVDGVSKIYSPVWKAEYVLSMKDKAVKGRVYVDAVEGEIIAKKKGKTISTQNLFLFMKLNNFKRRIIYQLSKQGVMELKTLEKLSGLPQDTFNANLAGLVEKAYVIISKGKAKLRLSFILPESILQDSLFEIQKVPLTPVQIPMDTVIEPKISPDYVKDVISTYRDIKTSAIDIVFIPTWKFTLSSKTGCRNITIRAF
jgi:hypothetical protein